MRLGRPVSFWECCNCLTRSIGPMQCVYCGSEYVMVSNAKKKAGPTMEECHDQFDKYRRERAKKKGKKPSSYAYGKDLATNLAAPFILRLKSGR